MDGRTEGRMGDHGQSNMPPQLGGYSQQLLCTEVICQEQKSFFYETKPAILPLQKDLFPDSENIFSRLPGYR